MGINYGPNGEVLHSNGRPFWYGPNGRAITSEQADRLLADIRKRRVARTSLRHGRERVTVSTVFLVLDQNPYGGLPVLWETMVFGGPSDGGKWRYTSRRDARKGHHDTVAFLKLAFAVEQAGRDQRRRMHASYRRRAFA